MCTELGLEYEQKYSLSPTQRTTQSTQTNLGLILVSSVTMTYITSNHLNCIHHKLKKCKCFYIYHATSSPTPQKKTIVISFSHYLKTTFSDIDSSEYKNLISKLLLDYDLHMEKQMKIWPLIIYAFHNGF